MNSVLLLLVLPVGQLPAPPGNGCIGTSQYVPSVSLQPPAARRDVVLQWNEVALNAIRAEKSPPPLASRNLAIVHGAMFDAVNVIQQTYRGYLINGTAAAESAPEAAAAVAAHCVLLNLYPKQVERFDAALDASLAAIADGPAKENGVRVGLYVAERFVAWRGKDGMTAQSAYRPSTGRGVWQPTPPDFRPPLLPQWPQVKCFAMRSASQFRPAGPPALDSAAYAASFDEVRALGSVNSRVRMRDQTEIAHFWADGAGTATPPGHWNQVAQTLALQRGTTMPENARLFALLNIAVADAAIGCWDCKYKFDLWRPITAIREVEPGWTPLIDTPPFPTYTSGHSTFSAAAATVLANFFGTDAIRFSIGSDGLPGVTRTFDGLWAAAYEASKSRIYGGIHWDFDCTDGLTTGRALGEYVARNFLQPRSAPLAAQPLPFATAQRSR